MSNNIKGKAKTLANNLSKARKLGIDIDYIPKGYSRLGERQLIEFNAQVLNDINSKLGRKGKSNNNVRQLAKKTKRKINRASQTDIKEVINEINKVRKDFPNNKSFKDFDKKHGNNIAFNQMSEILFMIDDFERIKKGLNIKGELTGKQLTKIAKKLHLKQYQLIKNIKEKFHYMKMENYERVFDFYGINDSKYIDMYNKANFKQKAFFVKILNDYLKGTEHYENDDTADLELPKDRFENLAQLYLKRGVDKYGNKID